MAESEVCCGFGGTFCVKYPEISTKMVDDKAATSTAHRRPSSCWPATSAACMNIAGRLKRLGSAVQVRHVAEVLAGEPRHAARSASAER